MSSNGLIYILFVLSWNFPNLLKTSGGSAVPFAFIFPAILVFPYIILVFLKKPLLEKKIFYVISLFIFTIVFSIYTIQVDLTEFVIRCAQIFNIVVIYIYTRKNFFLFKDEFNPIKVLFICQLPSILFGTFEVVYFFTSSLFMTLTSFFYQSLALLWLTLSTLKVTMVDQILNQIMQILNSCAC